MNIIEKYAYGERMRVITESIRRDDNAFLWKDASKFALRKLREKNINKIPLRIHLHRHWNITPEMNTVFKPHMAKAKNYQKYKFYTHEVF